MKKAKKFWMRAILVALTVSLLLQGAILVLPNEVKAGTVVIQPSEIDTYMEQDSLDATHTRSTLWVISEPNANNRALIRFDLSDVSIPSGNQITSATMYLDVQSVYMGTEDFDHPKDVDAYRVKTYWGEASACWHKEPDYEPRPTATATGDVETFDVTEVVIGWHLGEYENYGLMLRMKYENGDDEGDAWGWGYVPREGGLPGYQTPKLVIEYEAIDDYVDIEIVEPKMTVDSPEQWDVILSNNCTCPTLKSNVDYYGTLIDVRYVVTTDIPSDPWLLTLLATYEDDTGLWVAELDCWKLKDIGANHYIVTAEATVSGEPLATDSITVKVDNEWHTERLVWVWYYYSIPCYEPFANPTNPRQVYAEFEEFDGEHELFRVDIEAPFRPISSDPLWCIDIAVPDYWQIATESGQEIINIPQTDVYPTAPPPGSPYTQAYRIEKDPIEDPGMMWLYTEVTYKLWFLVDNPWYR